MVIALFSDIHGNIYSLEKAFKLFEKFKPDKFVFLGDMAGYYYSQNECIDLLLSLDNLISIRGNHDEYFLNSMKNKDYLERLIQKYGKSYEIFNKNISKRSLDFLNSMQISEVNTYFEAYHGTPNNYLEEYCYINSNIDFKVEAPLLFLGHTHYPMVLKKDYYTVINPGSIGQPRDFNKGSFCIVDTKDIKVENIRYEYPMNELKKQILNLNDNKYLIEILKREKNEKY